MKQITSISFMILFFFMINALDSKIQSNKARNNLKSVLNQVSLSMVNFTNQGYVVLNDITTFGNSTWVCTAKNQYIKVNTNVTAAVQGQNIFKSGEICQSISVNRIGDLYSVTSLGNLNVLKVISNVSSVWLPVNSGNITDVSTGPNSDTFAITVDGYIYKVKGSQLDPKKFNSHSFGANCKIAVCYERENIIYVIDSNAYIWRVSSTQNQHVYVDMGAYDVNCGQNYRLYIASQMGIYTKRNNIEGLSRIGDGIASNIAVGNQIWIKGLDNFPYMAPLDVGGISLA